MRYGKIYYYDRLGNRVQDDVIPEVKDELISFPHRLTRNMDRIEMFKRQDRFASDFSPPIRPVYNSYVPQDPFAKMNLDSPVAAHMPPDLREDALSADIAIRRPYRRAPDEFDAPADSLEGDRARIAVAGFEDTPISQGVSGSVSIGFQNGNGQRQSLPSPPENMDRGPTPLVGQDVVIRDRDYDDVSASREERADGERERYAAQKAVEELSLNDARAHVQGPPPTDSTPDIFATGADSIDSLRRIVPYSSMKASKSAGDLVAKKVVIDDDDGELCEHCLLEERRLETAQHKKLLQRELDEHVRRVNSELQEQRARKKPLHPMGVLPPFDRDDEASKKRDTQEAYRLELEQEMARRAEAVKLEKHRDLEMNNFANTRDAYAYAQARDMDRSAGYERNRAYDYDQKAVGAGKIGSRQEDGLEWWERKTMPGVLGVERDAKFMSDQLRRNAQLKDSVNQLIRYKEQQRELNIERRAASKAHFDGLRKHIDEQSLLTRWNPSGKASRAALEPTETNPTVFKAWQDAHLLNDHRYRVLQEIDAPVKYFGRVVDEESRCVRCRRCKRIIRREVRFREHH